MWVMDILYANAGICVRESPYSNADSYRDVRRRKNPTRVQLHINFTCMPFLGGFVCLSPGSSIAHCREIRGRKNVTYVQLCITFNFTIIPFK